MDDKQRQPARDDAETAREKGAALEYDAEDEAALSRPAPPPAQDKTPPDERK